MYQRSCLLLLGTMAFAVAAGCSPAESTDTDPTTTPSESDVLDVRVPEPEADPNYFDFVTPEEEIPAGEERMTCYHLEITEDLVVDNLEAYQGQFGHHVVFLTSKEPQPAGTVEDCTDRSTMSKYGPFVLPDTPLDPGYGIRIAKGTKVVAQIHYVNAGSKPILVRDVARLHKIPEASVNKWVFGLTVADNTLELPPAQKSSLSIDCTIPAGAEILVMGGHMHERGTRFETLMGKDEASLVSQYLADPWLTEYRDAPPVSLYFKNPLVVSEPTLMRTMCDWNNESPEAIIFPEEMCSTFGYVAGVDAGVECIVNP